MTGGVTALPSARYRHEAVLYAGDDGFLEVTLPFVRAAVTGGEPILVVEPPARRALLEERLGRSARSVTFVDPDLEGRNPARLAGLVASFLADHAGCGRRIRGVGESAGPNRSAAELRELELNELLANEFLSAEDRVWLRCSFDVAGLAPEVVAMARRTHPLVADPGRAAQPSGDFSARAADLLAASPPPSPRDAAPIRFDASFLPALRALVAELGRAAGLSDDRTAELVLAVDELATNSVRHGGGEGAFRSWAEDGALVVEVADAGHILDPFVGRLPPSLDGPGGRGLWIVNRLADLAQLHSGETGTVARCWFRR